MGSARRHGNPGFKVLVLLNAVRVFGDSIESVVIPWTALKTLNSLLGAAGVFAIQSAPWILMPLVAGSLMDRASGKAAASALTLQVALLVTLVATGPPSTPLTALVFYGLILAVSALDNITAYLPLKALPAMLGTTDEKALQKGNAVVGASERVARIAGFITAAPLAMVLGLRALLVDAAMLTVAVVVAALLTPSIFKTRYVVGTTPTGNGAVDPAGRVPRFLWWLILSVVAFNFAVGPWRVFLLDTLGAAGSIGEASYAIASATLPLAGVVASLIIAREAGALGKEGPTRQFVVGCLVETAFIASLTLLYFVQVPHVIFLAPALTTIMGFGDPLINVSLHTIFQSRVKYAILGRVRGLFDAVATATIMVSELITAYLLQQGVAATLPLTYSVLALVGTSLGAYALRDVAEAK